MDKRIKIECDKSDDGFWKRMLECDDIVYMLLECIILSTLYLLNAITYFKILQSFSLALRDHDAAYPAKLNLAPIVMQWLRRYQL